MLAPVADDMQRVDALIGARLDSEVALGWLAEGDGPDLVVMCAPR